MKKFMMVAVLVLGLAAAAYSQQGFELSLYGGYGMKNINAPSDYYYSWTGNYYYLDALGSSSYFDSESKGGMAFGASANYFFTPNIGVGLNFGYFRTSVTTTTLSDMWWSWFFGGTNYASDYLGYDLAMTGVDNYFQSMPLSLNFTARFGTNGFEGYVSAGPSLFLNKIFLESEIAYALEGNYGWSWQGVDVIMVPTEINESWTAFGANFGAGFTFWVSPMIGLTADARYFLCGKKAFDWAFFTGTYDGLYGNFTYPFDSYDIDWIYSEGLITTPIEIDPSFFQFTAGIKIRLGGY